MTVNYTINCKFDDEFYQLVATKENLITKGELTIVKNPTLISKLFDGPVVLEAIGIIDNIGNLLYQFSNNIENIDIIDNYNILVTSKAYKHNVIKHYVLDGIFKYKNTLGSDYKKIDDYMIECEENNKYYFYDVKTRQITYYFDSIETINEDYIGIVYSLDSSIKVYFNKNFNVYEIRNCYTNTKIDITHEDNYVDIVREQLSLNVVDHIKKKLSK